MSKMAKRFYTSGSTVRLIEYTEGALTDTLAPAIYSLRFNQMSGFYLKKICDKFSIPKLYGKVTKRTAKIMHTYATRTANTGVLLSGDKGTGKSLQSMALSNASIDNGQPVILINEAYYGADFEELMNAIPNAVLIFDEFGKVYKNDSDGNDPQEKLLSFFDGQSSQKRLMIFTENATDIINSFMLNRPGRIFYHYKYTKLEADVIEEYLTELKVPADSITYIQNFATTVREFSFDSLKAIAEEVLRYPDEEITELIEELNITGATEIALEVLVHSIVDIKNRKYSSVNDAGLPIKFGKYHDLRVSVLVDGEGHEEMKAKAQAAMDSYLVENPEDAPTTSIADFLPRASVSGRQRPITSKNGVTYFYSDDKQYVIGMVEAPKTYVNTYELIA